MFDAEDVERSVVLSDAEDDGVDEPYIGMDEDDKHKKDLEMWTGDNVYCFTTTVKIHLSRHGDDGHPSDTVRVVKYENRTYILGRLQKPNNVRACAYRAVLVIVTKSVVTGFGQKEHVNALRMARDDLRVDRKQGSASPYFEVATMKLVENGPLGDGLLQYTQDVYNDVTKEYASALRMWARNACEELMATSVVAERVARDALLTTTTTTKSVEKRKGWQTEDEED